MYSPKIYEAQVPALYHAAQATKVPMTKLVNAFVYEGLATGYYGLESTNRMPNINEVLPWINQQPIQAVGEIPINPSTLQQPYSIDRLHLWYDQIQRIAEKNDGVSDEDLAS